MAIPITLAGLSNGPHQVEVIGNLDTGIYQNDPMLSASGGVSRSRTWTVRSAE